VNAAEFREKYGREYAYKIAKKAGISPVWFNAICNRWQIPSRKTALALDEASGGEMDAGELIKVRHRTEDPDYMPRTRRREIKIAKLEAEIERLKAKNAEELARKQEDSDQTSAA